MGRIAMKAFWVYMTIFFVQADQVSKPSMYDLCRPAYCRRCLSAVLHNPFKTENSDYSDIDGPTEDQLFLRQGMIELVQIRACGILLSMNQCCEHLHHAGTLF